MKATKRREVVKKLKKLGFVISRESKHQIWSKNGHSVTLPRHNEIAPGTMRDIEKTIKLVLVKGV